MHVDSVRKLIPIFREKRILVDGPQFVLASTDEDLFADRERWVIPLEGEVRTDDGTAGEGDCLLLQQGEHISKCGRMLIGATA